MKNILEDAVRIENQIIIDRRTIHQNPEVGFYLPNTADYVREKLAEMGIPSKLCGGTVDNKTRKSFIFAGYPDMQFSTGVVATIGSGKPCILLRAEMDALPMDESDNLVEFASKKQNAAHMCGHDAHTAMLLGAAKILKDKEAQLKGTVKLMFQTGEECGCGARLMVENNIMKNPEVDAAFAIHIDPQTEVGKIVYTSGIMSAAMDTFMLKIKGKGGHSSMPQICIDPLLIANQLYTALNLLGAREVAPRETVALTVGKVCGGTASNIIPDVAEIAVGIRTFNRVVREHMLERVPQIIEHTVKMWRGEYELIDFHTPSTYADEKLCEEMIPYIEQIIGVGNVEAVDCSTGTEDFGYITENVPGMLVYLGTGGVGKEPLHSPDMVVDESTLKFGAAVYANCAMEWLEKNN